MYGSGMTKGRGYTEEIMPESLFILFLKILKKERKKITSRLLWQNKIRKTKLHKTYKGTNFRKQSYFREMGKIISFKF